ncbi:putative pentatricopeptide repeat-containing protein At5g40405 isoform X2 [Prosopis cineraria]|uniref:putative pentatricopeptide repeat-containing protein At5g40405 isoform X2 n=1 Tax=Prosopis cineraria TaxID=364024 RepID=UPI00240FCDAA|nr:putative pentatricopeptide repeat-containing protein At5g40405 isoform X2 [Prosopis cineraria]
MPVMNTLTFIAKHPTISLIQSSTTLRELKQIHTQLLQIGILNNPHFHGQFVATIALDNPTNHDYSIQLLNQYDNPSTFSFNSLIRAYSKSSSPHRSFHFYNQILHSRNNLSPDNYTFNFLVRSCAQLLVREVGLSVHGAVIKYGFESDPHVQSGLIFMYGELGCLSSCRGVYEAIAEPDLVSKTTMVKACAECGDIDFARQVFDEMPVRDTVAWNAMIAGYAQSGRSREALDLFNLMQIKGVKVDEVSMVSILFACTHLGTMDQGRWAHAYIQRNKLRMTVTLGTALIDMYAKCGNIYKAMEIFWGMKEKNVYTWSSAIGGLAMNGFGKECLDLFSLMKQDGVQPNEVTFISVLRGCSVIGLVEEGQKHFESMKNLYGIDPKLEHYGLMVDLCGRAGRLEEAMNFINNMPVEPHAGAWTALLNACRMYNNRELGGSALRKVLELEFKNDGAYVLLSNIYADDKNWERVNSLRKMMKADGVNKVPGCSVIEVYGEVHEFIVGDKSHPRYDEIETMLAEISSLLRLSGSLQG